MFPRMSAAGGAQLCIASQACCPCADAGALLVSVPGSTLVVKSTCWLGGPDPPSVYVQWRMTLSGCQAPSGESQEDFCGASSSTMNVYGPAVEQLPALSHT